MFIFVCKAIWINSVRLLYLAIRTQMQRHKCQFSEGQQMQSPNQESITLATNQVQVYLKKSKIYQADQSKLKKIWHCLTKQYAIAAVVALLFVMIITVYILNNKLVYSQQQAKEQYSLAYNQDNTNKFRGFKNSQKGINKNQRGYKQRKQFGVTTLKMFHPSTKSDQQPQQQKYEDFQYEYDVNGAFSMWSMNSTYKKLLFSKYKALNITKQISKPEQYIDINHGKDQEFIQFAKEHQSTIEVVQWFSIQLNVNDMKRISDDFDRTLHQRRINTERLIAKYKKEYEGRQGLLNPKKNITCKRFLQSLEYQKLTGQDFKKNPQLKKVYQNEKQYYRKAYRTDKPTYEIPACIIAPTYNNVVDHRYIWHLQSIFQQEYLNYRLIIIDDASTDQTSNRISQYLKWRNADPTKIFLIRNKVHKTAMPNIYYSIHRYCDYNQILYIIDGDDELVGTQVFKLFNALYQQHKSYIIYSSHFQYESKNDTHPVVLGLPFAYPEQIKRKAGYRTYEHAYSQLRTVMSDLFLLINTASLKDEYGEFYWTISDNALYFSAMEMSCGRVEYIPELQYWYNADTSVNDWRTKQQKKYREIKKHINYEQRHYKCINSRIQQIKAAVEGVRPN